jgi:hypothetical protein
VRLPTPGARPPSTGVIENSLLKNRKKCLTTGITISQSPCTLTLVHLLVILFWGVEVMHAFTHFSRLPNCCVFV